MEPIFIYEYSGIAGRLRYYLNTKKSSAPEWAIRRDDENGKLFQSLRSQRNNAMVQRDLTNKKISSARFYEYEEANFSDLIGETIENVYIKDGQGPFDGDGIFFHCQSGKVFVQYHEKDGDETVDIEDITGDIGDLIGEKILSAYESNSYSKETSEGNVDYSETWTFYHIRTINNTITIRWYGSSNGYYSEEVNFARLV